jgi:pimeloyl-ACP methyl ester carboxylesterase
MIPVEVVGRHGTSLRFATAGRACLHTPVHRLQIDTSKRGRDYIGRIPNYWPTQIMVTSVKLPALSARESDSLPVEGIGTLVEGHGTPVVLLHSSLSSKHQWRKLIDRMRGRHRLIAIDLHGYGETSLPSCSECFTLNDEVRLVESVLASLLQSHERFHLVGHSYGGVVALQLAQKHAQHVCSLSLFEPIPFHLFSDYGAALVEVHLVWHQIEAGLRNNDAGAGAAYFIDYWSGHGTFSRMSEDRQAMMARLLPKTIREFQAVSREPLRKDAYKRIAVPSCLISGTESPRLAHTATSILAELLPNARQHRIAAGHMAPMTDPQLVNPIIDRFIRCVDGAFTANEEVEVHPSAQCGANIYP